MINTAIPDYSFYDFEMVVENNRTDMGPEPVADIEPPGYDVVCNNHSPQGNLGTRGSH